MEDQCNRNNTIELSTENESEYLYYSTYNRLFYTVGIALIATFGSINNLAFLFVLYRVKRMRTTINFYLGNLACTDMGFLITTGTLELWSYLVLKPVELGTPQWSNFACSAPYFVYYALYYSSIFLVTIVTAERYFAICHPMIHKRLDGRGRAIKLVLISWTLSFALALFEADPASIESTCLQFPIDSHQPQIAGHLLVLRECNPQCQWCWQATYITDQIQFMLALFACLVMNVIIVKNLSKRDAAMGMSSDNAERDTATRRSMIQARNAVARMLTVNSIVFFLCMLPFSMYNIYQIVLTFGGPPLMSKENAQTLFRAGFFLTLTNSSINPFIYGVTNSRYRIAYQEAFTSKCHATKDASSAKSLSHRSGTVNTNVWCMDISHKASVPMLLCPKRNGIIENDLCVSFRALSCLPYFTICCAISIFSSFLYDAALKFYL